jgi:hypothetical protein
MGAMAKIHEPCIYCDNTHPDAFHGREHVIAQAFGKYAGQTPTLDCVCDECNKLFGRDLDTVHARDTPEGILRSNAGLLSSEVRPQKRVKTALPEETGDWSRMRLSKDLTTGKLMEPTAQLVVLNPKTGETEEYFERDIANLSLPDEVYGARESRKWWVFAHNDHAHAAFVAKLQTAGIDFRPGKRMLPPSLSLDVNGEPLLTVHAVIDDVHKRALAKTLMNLVAFVVGADEVRGKAWDQTRRYVRHGEGEMRARLSRDPFWPFEATEGRMPDDSINVAIFKAEIGVVGGIEYYNRVTYVLAIAEGHTIAHEFGVRLTSGKRPIIFPLVGEGVPEELERLVVRREQANDA